MNSDDLAEIEEARRARHWTDAIRYVSSTIGFIAVLAFLFGLIYLAHHNWTF